MEQMTNQEPLHDGGNGVGKGQFEVDIPINPPIFLSFKMSLNTM